jgi:hypothetical protein
MWLSNSLKIRCPLSSCEILTGFDQNSSRNPDQYSDQKIRWPRKSYQNYFERIRWPRNSCEILQEFWSEFWWPALVSRNSDDYRILQKLDDHGIFVKFFQDLIRILQVWDYHGILQKFWSEFWWPSLVSNNSDDYQILQELDDHRIIMKLSRDFDQNSYENLKGFWSELSSKIRWPQNSYIIFQEFLIRIPLSDKNWHNCWLCK